MLIGNKNELETSKLYNNLENRGNIYLIIVFH